MLDFAPSFHEWTAMTSESLATIFRVLHEALRGRKDVVLFGAQAVNVYVRTPRATEDLDLQSTHAAALAKELRDLLHAKFHLAVRVREVVPGGFRIYEKKRHLVDIRQVDTLPALRSRAGLQVMAPVPLMATKLVVSVLRAARAKGGTDLADLRRLGETFPELKVRHGAVEEELKGAPRSIQKAWERFVETPIEPDDDGGW
jgi:hypothetical protein